MSRAFQSNELKQEWFRNVISRFHTMNPSIVSNEGLVKTNQDTIKYMISELKERSKPRVNFAKGTKEGTKEGTKKEPTSIEIDRSTEYSRNQPNRPDVLQNTFDLRKQEYETMFKKPDAPDVSFTENLEDQAIKNMDELIKEQIKLRELDLYPQGSPPPSNPSDKVEINAIEIEIIEPPPLSPSQPIDQKVQILEEKIKDLEKELQEIRALFAKSSL